MKGIAHFITGVTIATFFPEVVQQAAGGSVLPMLGGIAGILPDTLDFKFARYFERYDLEIDPGPDPDARDIAEQVVGAMRRAYETRKPQNIMLHTIRLGADLWRQYTIRFDPEQEEVAVRVGPVVNTG
ncbi:MAG: archaeal/vacuolar-type H+-ATPase subunit I, partial [Anaerolineae bacterium]|nr:archaeal/vacuolar-type H+-ATPase subunit I [Anaerolineae bacterium]